MSELLNLLLVIVLLFNFLMLGTSRVRAVIDAAAAQGILLGVAYLTMHGASGLRALALGVAIDRDQGRDHPADPARRAAQPGRSAARSSPS